MNSPRKKLPIRGRFTRNGATFTNACPMYVSAFLVSFAKPMKFMLRRPLYAR